MRTLILSLICCLVLQACVQDEGKISNGSVSDSGSTSGGSSGSTSGGSTGGSSGSTDDPLYEYQWHLNNTGQDVGSYVDFLAGWDTTPLSGIDINAEEAHELGYTGNGVRIAVSDSGTDYNHADLDGNFLSDVQRNYASIDPNRWSTNADSYPSGNEAHGTAVAGIIAAEGWNGYGGRGVAPDASFTAFKYIMDIASFDHLSSNEDKLLHQLQGDFDIFNYSYGYNQCLFFDDYTDEDVVNMLKDQVANGRGGLGTIYVQSAGNSYMEDACFGHTSSTATLNVPYKIVTAAISADGIKSSYSTPGPAIWVSGLGGEGMADIDSTATTNYQYIPAIFTTDIQDCSSGASFRNPVFQTKNPFNYGFDTELNPLCNFTNTMNGTSSAAPMVSGVVALMLEANPYLTWRDVKHILAETAVMMDYDPADNELTHPLDPLIAYSGYVYDYKWEANFVNKWYSNWYGFGLVDAEAAVRMAETWVPAPLGDLGTYVRTENASGIWTHTSSPNTPITDADMSDPAIDEINGVTALTIESVQVRLTTNHTFVGELAIHLISPSGTERRILTADSYIVGTGSSDYYFSTNAFYGENSGGKWTIKVYDPNALDVGNIQSWAINIHGH